MFALKANAQKFEASTKSFYGLWNTESSEYYYGGGGLELSYDIPLNKGAIKTGLEFRSIDWGNQLSLNIGYNAPYITKEKWALHGITTVGLGMALFYDNSLFAWSIGYTPEFVFRKDKRLNIGLGLGLRYTQSPRYKDYGSINQVLEIPLRVGFKFHLTKQKKDEE